MNMIPEQIRQGMCYEEWQDQKKKQEEKANQSLLMYVMGADIPADDDADTDPEQRHLQAECRQLCKMFVKAHKNSMVYVKKATGKKTVKNGKVVDEDEYEELSLNAFLKSLEDGKELPWAALAEKSYQWARDHEEDLRIAMHGQFDDIMNKMDKLQDHLPDPDTGAKRQMKKDKQRKRDQGANKRRVRSMSKRIKAVIRIQNAGSGSNSPTSSRIGSRKDSLDPTRIDPKYKLDEFEVQDMDAELERIQREMGLCDEVMRQNERLARQSEQSTNSGASSFVAKMNKNASRFPNIANKKSNLGEPDGTSDKNSSRDKKLGKLRFGGDGDKLLKRGRGGLGASKDPNGKRVHEPRMDYSKLDEERMAPNSHDYFKDRHTSNKDRPSWKMAGQGTDVFSATGVLGYGTRDPQISGSSGGFHDRAWRDGGVYRPANFYDSMDDPYVDEARVEAQRLAPGYEPWRAGGNVETEHVSYLGPSQDRRESYREEVDVPDGKKAWKVGGKDRTKETRVSYLGVSDDRHFHDSVPSRPEMTEEERRAMKKMANRRTLESIDQRIARTKESTSEHRAAVVRLTQYPSGYDDESGEADDENEGDYSERRRSKIKKKKTNARLSMPRLNPNSGGARKKSVDSQQTSEPKVLPTLFKLPDMSPREEAQRSPFHDSKIKGASSPTPLPLIKPRGDNPQSSPLKPHPPPPSVKASLGGNERRPTDSVAELKSQLLQEAQRMSNHSGYTGLSHAHMRSPSGGPVAADHLRSSGEGAAGGKYIIYLPEDVVQYKPDYSQANVRSVVNSLVDRLVPEMAVKISNSSTHVQQGGSLESFVRNMQSEQFLVFAHEAAFGSEKDGRREMSWESGVAQRAEAFLQSLREQPKTTWWLQQDPQLARMILMDDTVMLQKVLKCMHRQLRSQQNKYVKVILKFLESKMSSQVKNASPRSSTRITRHQSHHSTTGREEMKTAVAKFDFVDNRTSNNVVNKSW